MKLLLSSLKTVLKVFVSIFLLSSFSTFVLSVFLLGYSLGVSFAWDEFQKEINALSASKISSALAPTPVPSERKESAKPRSPTTTRPTWGGPELWEVVNKRRIELGVNPLSTKSELCTIAAIRLNELLEKGKLDGHEGFSNMPERRPDLKWIFDKYDLSEFLLSGAKTPQEAVSLWENTLGHKKLLSAGEYVWGCIYAQYGFAVAIAGF